MEVATIGAMFRPGEEKVAFEEFDPIMEDFERRHEDQVEFVQAREDLVEMELESPELLWEELVKSSCKKRKSKTNHWRMPGNRREVAVACKESQYYLDSVYLSK